ncbi:hypothetical protein GGR54DRAFT_621527 [Hypoxylon sp. NC1633]|nr:hypothetical protein GGR54DRAFT_621527 [Hypoxylon sp. NC1633]
MPGSESTPLLVLRNPASRSNLFWILGCLYGATAVGFGAFGAHGLKKTIKDPAKLANFATAAQYQMVHSIALLVASQRTQNLVPGALFTAGMTMFSGSLYALVVDPVRFRWMGPVTPLGGLCLIAGWVALALV